MKISHYLKDKIVLILLYIITSLIISAMLSVFKVNNEAIIGVNVTLFIFIIIYLIYDYLRKNKFYSKFLANLDHLDQKYLIIETLTKPTFYDGEILYDSLYEINKSMNEKVKEYRLNLNSFKDYIEMWIHEVKLPLSSINLMLHNKETLSIPKVSAQLKRLDDDVEQVLYYVRSENAEKDYLIKETNLNKIISNVAIQNKDILLEKNIELEVQNTNIDVLTDAKWLGFIINQIISNSIKYTRDNPVIKISSQDQKDKILLKIYDNGIGIPKRDLPKVFDKTFTGSNGRKITTSTGMGLYIAKKLCQKLGHQITINSKENEFTEVTIIFYKNVFLNIAK